MLLIAVSLGVGALVLLVWRIRRLLVCGVAAEDPA